MCLLARRYIRATFLEISVVGLGRTDCWESRISPMSFFAMKWQKKARSTKVQVFLGKEVREAAQTAAGANMHGGATKNVRCHALPYP